MPSKPGLTLEQHRIIGDRLKSITDDLMFLALISGNCIGHSKKVAKTAARAEYFANQLQGDLDSQMAEVGRDLGDHEYNGIYYRGRSDPDRSLRSLLAPTKQANQDF